MSIDINAILNQEKDETWSLEFIEEAAGQSLFNGQDGCEIILRLIAIIHALLDEHKIKSS